MGSVFDPISSTEPRFPKSLYLIGPLFSTYELNPVAANAQASVPIPEGLDLDAWIVPSEALACAEDADDGIESQFKTSKKGKEREMNGKSKKGKKKRKDDSNVVANPVPVPVETADDRLEVEQVRDMSLEVVSLTDDIRQRRAERLERMRDDPYYIVDAEPAKPAHEDLDAIPIVHLEDMPPLPKSK